MEQSELDHPSAASGSVVDDILRHTRPLLPEDAEVIRTQNSTLGTQKHDLEAQIAALLEQTLRVQAELRQVSATFDKTNSVFAPIHALPNEILLYIFQLLLPSFHRDSCMDVNDVRFRLAAVCGWWRDVVTHSPTLWSTLVLRTHNSTIGSMTALRKFIQLSADQPLKISFIFRAAGLPGHRDLEVLDALIAESHRWRYLSMDDMFSVQYVFERLTPESIPQLEELYLVGRHSALRGRTLEIDPIAHAPALKKAQLFSGYPYASTLTHAYLSLPNDAGETFVPDFFNSHPFLTEVHIFLHDSHSALVLPPDIEPVKHAAVQTLVTDHTSVLDCLVLPSLQTLHLTTTNLSTDQSTTASVSAHLKRSGSHLKFLSIAQQAIYDSSALIAELLPLLSDSLSALYIDMYYSISPNESTARIFSALKSSSKSAGLLPKLTSFGLKAKATASPEFTAGLMEMLRSRRSSDLATQWKAKTLLDLGLDLQYFERDGHSSVFETALQELADDGLKLWTKNENKYGSRPSAYPPWIEFSKKKDLMKLVAGNGGCDHCAHGSSHLIEIMTDYSESDTDSVHDSDSDSSDSSSASSWSPAYPEPLPFNPYNDVPSVPYGAPLPAYLFPNSQNAHRFVPYAPQQNVFAPYPAMFAPQVPPPVHPYQNDTTGPYVPAEFPSPSDTSQNGGDRHYIHRHNNMYSPLPPGPPVIPEFPDDESDDEAENVRPSFPPIPNGMVALGGIGHAPADFPYPFNGSAIPQSPSDFPYPFNMPMENPPMSMPSPDIVSVPVSPLKESKAFRSRSRGVSPPGEMHSPASILLQTEESSSHHQTPEMTHLVEIAERPLSPLQFDNFEDLALEDPDADGGKNEPSTSVDSGYAELATLVPSPPTSFAH